MVLHYETHSTTLDNEAGRATGWLPGELSPLGRRQAQELGRRYANCHLDAILVSDLRRAVQTADIAFGDLDVPRIPDARLREYNYGRLNGMPAAQLHAEQARHLDAAWPEGESYRDVLERMRSFLHDIASHHPEWAQVLVIAHSANKWALDCLLLGARLEDLIGQPFVWQPGWRYELPASPGASTR